MQFNIWSSPKHLERHKKFWNLQKDKALLNQKYSFSLNDLKIKEVQIVYMQVVPFQSLFIAMKYIKCKNGRETEKATKTMRTVIVGLVSSAVLMIVFFFLLAR